MYETRTFDIENYKIMHINRVANLFIEEYTCDICGKVYSLLIAITSYQKRNLEIVIDFAKKET